MKKENYLILTVVILITYIVTRELTLSQMKNSLEAKTTAPEIKKNSDSSLYEREQIKNNILKASQDFQSCYFEYLKSKPNNQNLNVKVDWMIRKDGTVKNANLVSSESNQLGNCVVEKLKNLQFPPPPNETEFYAYHIFNFKTQEQLELEEKSRKEMEAKFQVK